MILDDIFEAMKPSDIPTVMRKNRLTMRDIEKERPQGAYRFTVGDKEFMDLDAAQEFARGTGETVKPIRETIKKKLGERSSRSSARIERILKQLRARHPQAQDDLEALVYDFRSQQSQDRRDISRLDAENDSEEADIDELQAMIDDLRRRRGITEKKKPVPTNKPLWGRAKAAARSKFDVYPSAYANAWAAKWYKSHGGGWRMGKGAKK